MLNGIDISKWDAGWTPDNAVNPIGFVIQRASWALYKDSGFDTLLSEVLKIPIRGAYHYYSSGVPWKLQADLLLATVVDKGFAFYVLDYEQGFNNLSARTIAEAAEFVKYIKDQTGRPCLIYFNPDTFKINIMPNNYGTWANLQDVWIAQYPRSIGQKPLASAPALPSGLKTWRIWQYGADVANTAGKNAGRDYGGITPSMDLNYYNGTAEQMLAWLNLPVSPPPPPPPSRPAVVVVLAGVKVRKGPGGNFAQVGTLAVGTKVQILAEQKDASGNTWGQISTGWACMIYLGHVYIKYTDVP